ncbi:MAG: Cys-tRNA(Pro) deacylase [Oscillospiraceae bacterium]|nr:Cys-tRNA(Pro) deacylase [Oscillospiraceae bacterium]
MSKEKTPKTNAMRILDKMKIPYRANFYDCDEFIDGVHIADKLSQPYEISFKTLMTVGRSGGHFVFVIPVDQELDMKKAASSVGEKSIEMLHVKDIKNVTGYIRGGCTSIGMKKPYKTVVDISAKNHEEIIISGGALGVQIFITPDNLQKANGAVFCDIIK